MELPSLIKKQKWRHRVFLSGARSASDAGSAGAALQSALLAAAFAPGGVSSEGQSGDSPGAARCRPSQSCCGQGSAEQAAGSFLF